MDGGSRVDQSEIQQDPNPLVRKSMVEGLVVIDQGQWLDELRNQIKEANPQTDEEKIVLVEQIVTGSLKDAIHARKNPDEYMQHQQAIDAALTDSPTNISTIIEGGYGVCRDFHALGLTGLEEMGMEATFHGNAKYRHTFLEVKKDGNWEPFDPFAKVYFQNEDGNPRLFPQDCYTGSNILLFGQTSHTKDAPVLNQPTPNPAKISLGDLKARIGGNRVQR